MGNGKKLNAVEIREQIDSEAFAQALLESESASSLTQSKLISTGVPSLGEKIDTYYRKIYKKLSSEKHVKPEEIAHTAKKWFWIAQRHKKLMRLGWIDAGVEVDNDYTRLLAESLLEVYGRNLGYAFFKILHEKLYENAIGGD